MASKTMADVLKGVDFAIDGPARPPMLKGDGYPKPSYPIPKPSTYPKPKLPMYPKPNLPMYPTGRAGFMQSYIR